MLGLVCAVLAAACTGSTARPEKNAAAEATPERGGVFLWLRDVDGFDSIDDEHIVLHAGRRLALVKTFGPCYGLRDSETIAVDATLDHLDARAPGSIIYRMPFGERGRCPIDRVVEVSSLQEAKEQVAKERNR
jgi:hypothetical protein